MVVNPVGLRWQAHEYALGAAVCFESEAGTSVPHEIEFDIATSAQVLPFFLCGRKRKVGFAGQQLAVSGGKYAAYVHYKCMYLFSAES